VSLRLEEANVISRSSDLVKKKMRQIVLADQRKKKNTDPDNFKGTFKSKTSSFGFPTKYRFKQEKCWGGR